MASPAASIDHLTLDIVQEIHVKAPLDITFAALLEQLGPASVNEKGEPMNHKLEAWPGGRWYRDLGNNTGHFWATVQAIKPPMLLEFAGPLFLSYPVVSNVQYRLSQEGDGTLIKLHHAALGMIPDDMRQGIHRGWGLISERIRDRAEARAAGARGPKH
jgi:hypothetical protein